MSWLSKQLGSAKKIFTDPKKWAENAGRTVGKGAKIAAPFLPPGFREIAAVGGSLAAGDNRKENLMNLAATEIGGAMGGRSAGKAIGKGFNAVKAAGLKQSLAAIPGAAKSFVGGGNAPVSGDPTGGVNLDPNTGLEIMGGAPPSIDGGGILRSAVGGDGGINKWQMGLAGLQGLNSAYLGNKANNLSEDALKSTQADYASRAGLRKRAIEGLEHPIAPDTSELSRIRSTNPYALPLAVS